VPMILAAIVIARNPSQYGFDFEAEPPHAYDRVTLPRPVDLRRVAEWTDTTIDTIQEMNPELRRWTTPVRDSSYRLKVPKGAAEVVKARLEASERTELASLNWYVVKKGETLATIARKIGVSRADLAEANYLRATAPVNVGLRLIVPREAKVLIAARTNDRPVLAADSQPMVKDTVVAAVNSSANGQAKVTYQVQRGDTLGSIARQFSTSVASIQSWNQIPGTQIRVGDRLTIYTTRAN